MSLRGLFWLGYGAFTIAAIAYLLTGASVMLLVGIVGVACMTGALIAFWE